MRWAMVFLTLATVGASAAEKKPSVQDRARLVLQWHAQEVRPLEKKLNELWWTANVTGKAEDFTKKEAAQNAYDDKLSAMHWYSEIKALRNALPKSTDADLRRQMEVLYLMMTEKQVPADLLKKISAKSNAIEKTFNVARAKVDGKELAASEVKKILQESADSKQRQAVWEASKVVGAEVEKDLKELVGLRNQAAKKLGFPNYHAMMLRLNEQEPKDVLKLFDNLDNLTRKPFLKVKGDIDAKLAANYQIPVKELQPWHYHDPFFQEAPSVFETNLDVDYQKQDIVALSRAFYAGIGLPVDDVLKSSDLFEKPGKSPHAFCTDIDREGDVRVLANVVPNESWMNTMLHELGHAVYSSKNIPLSVPYLLRCDAHILTTEGVGMLFQKFSKSADWLTAMGVKVRDAKAFNAAGRKLQQAELLIFSRWAQVMFRFEKAMYEKPNQNLNTLWWSLVEKYQGLTPPKGRNAPDYASKIHIVVAPAYYHNYLMGELFAAQVHHTIVKEVLKAKDPRTAQYIGNKAVGTFFKEKVFGPGRRMPWNELTRFATGQPLSPKAFAADLAD